MIKSGFRGQSSESASLMQSTGVPLVDHIFTPSFSRRSFSVSGVVAEKAQEKPLRAESGAQTMTSPKSCTISIRLLMPLAW